MVTLGHVLMYGSLVLTVIGGAGIMLMAADEPAAPAAISDRDGATVVDDALRLDSSNAVRFEDPRGDATDWGAGDAGTLARCATEGWLTEDCVAEPARVPAAGTPAPHFDIVSVAYEGETADAVVVSLGIAALSEDYGELADPDGLHRMVEYEVCWAPDIDSGCDRAVSLDVMVHDGSAHAEPKLQVRGTGCNEWSWCGWGVDVDIEFGSPTTMTFTVPKAYLTVDDAPLTAHHMAASVSWVAESNAFPAWHPGVTAHTPAYHFHTHGTGVSAPNVPDVTEPFPVDLAFAEPELAPAPPADEPLLVGHPGTNHGHRGPFDHVEMDILAFDLYEEGDDLLAAFLVSEYEDTPGYDFDYSVAVGIGEDVYEIGYRHEGGETYGYAGRCVMEPCQDGVIMEPEVEIQPGAPATITVRTPLEFVGDPDDGTATNLLWTMTMVSDVNYYWGDHTDEDGTYGDYHSVFMVDSLVGGHPYVFGSGHRATAPQQAHHA